MAICLGVGLIRTVSEFLVFNRPSGFDLSNMSDAFEGFHGASVFRPASTASTFQCVQTISDLVLALGIQGPIK